MNAALKIKTQLTEDSVKEMFYQLDITFIEQEPGIRCACPIHNGDNPTAFVWNFENHLWYCFTGDCGGGDIFDLISVLFGIGFKKAVVKAAELLEIDIEGLELGERTDDWRQETRAWLDYMMSQTNQRNAEYDVNKLGSLFRYKSYRNFTRETLEHFNVYYAQTFDRLAVPLYDEDNTCIGVTMRAKGNATPKWLNQPNHIKVNNILYNLNNTKNDTTNSLYIVEGVFDVWNLYQLGVQNVVATLGSKLSNAQEQLILKYYTDVISAYDNDKAGHKATKKIIQTLQNKCNLCICDLGDFNDPGEIPNIERLAELSYISPCQYMDKDV